jgi:hypothetical protein
MMRPDKRCAQKLPHRVRTTEHVRGADSSLELGIPFEVRKPIWNVLLVRPDPKRVGHSFDPTMAIVVRAEKLQAVYLTQQSSGDRRCAHEVSVAQSVSFPEARR